MMGAQNFDTVAEVQVLTTNYQAEYGRSSAGPAAAGHQERHAELPRQRVLEPPERRARRQHLDAEARRAREVAAHLQRLRLHARRADLHSRHVQHQQAEAVLLLGPGVAARSHRRRADGHRADRRDAERRLQRVLCPATRRSRPADRTAVPGQRHSARAASARRAARCSTRIRCRLPDSSRARTTGSATRRSSTTSGRTASRSTGCRRSKHRVAVRHTWAPNVWNDPEPMGVYSTIWDYPGRTLAATLTSTLVQLADQRVLVLVGLDQPVEILRAAQLRLLSRAASTPSSIRRRSRSASTIRTCSRAPSSIPDKIPNVSLQGVHGRQQRRVSGILERLRVPVGRQRHQDHRQPRVQGRHQHRAIGHERSHSAQLRAGAGDDEPERIVPLHRRASAGGTTGLQRRQCHCSGCSTTTRSSATSRTRSGWRWPTTSTCRTAGSRRTT